MGWLLSFMVIAQFIILCGKWYSSIAYFMVIIKRQIIFLFKCLNCLQLIVNGI